MTSPERPSVPGPVFTREHLTGLRPDPIAQAAAATEQAIRDDTNRRLAEPMIARWRAMSEQQRADATARAEAEQERRVREAREARQRWEVERQARYEATRDRADPPLVRALVDMHAPIDEHGFDVCAGCPQSTDRDGYDEHADWPCDTFLLIERGTAS